MTQGSFPDTDMAMPDAHVIAAGKGRRLWFEGRGFTIYKARAKVYPTRDAARAAMQKITLAYRRPDMRVERLHADPGT